jgi:transcriptional regulator of met regulon
MEIPEHQKKYYLIKDKDDVKKMLTIKIPMKLIKILSEQIINNKIKQGHTVGRISSFFIYYIFLN